MTKEAYKETLSSIVNSFINYNDKRCVLLSMRSKGLDTEKGIQIRFKKYAAEDSSLYLICEVIFLDDNKVISSDPVLFGDNDINDILEELASDIMSFEETVSFLGEKVEYNFSEDNTDIESLSDVRDIEREEIKKFLVKNNFRLHKYIPSSETIVPINKLPEFLEQCFIDQEIKAVSTIMDVKDIGMYSIYLSKATICNYNEIARLVIVISSNIQREPFMFCCTDPFFNKELYTDDAKRKVIDALSNHLDHLIKLVKNKNGVDKIKVQCTCSILYKYEEVEEKYYEY